MKKKLTIFTFIVLNLISCAQEKTGKFELTDINGTWRIDSVAENLIYNKREAINEEFFVFNNGNFRMKKIENGEEFFMDLGSGVFNGDTLVTRTPKGAPGFKFVVSFPKKDVLQLDECHPISTENSRKPTFFLSKKEDD